MIPRLDRDDRPVRTVVFSTDDNYAAPAGVVIRSLLDTFSAEVFCDVVILDNGIAEENRKRLEALGVPDRSAVRIVDVSHIAEDAPVHGHFTKATYIHLFIPFLFRTHDKVLYLDCDMVVRKDVSALFELEFNGEYMAAASDIGISEENRRRERVGFRGRWMTWPGYVKRYLGVADGDSRKLINGGVYLFNIAAIAQDDFAVLRDLNHHVHFGYIHHGQCAAIRLYQSRIKHLHLRWNLQVQNMGRPRPAGWLDQEYLEARQDPAIVHFITRFKPWREFQVPYEEDFWDAARKTEWFHELHEQRLTRSFRKWLRQSELAPASDCSETPQFSIIMPVFNRAEDIHLSIRSVLLQDFRDFELIIVDDASTDRTAEVVRHLAKRDARIRLMSQKGNQGPGKARNDGIATARGKYIGICDSDDFLAPGSLERFARQIQNQEADVVAGSQFVWNSRQERAFRDNDFSRIERDARLSDFREIPEFWTLIHFHRCMIRREFLLQKKIEYPPLRRVENPAYLAEVYSRASSFLLMQDPVYLFHARAREYHLSAAEIGDAYTGHGLIHTTLEKAGYGDIAYLFDCLSPPFWLAYDWISEEESLALSARLIELVKSIPPEALDHPYLENADFDKAGFHHDYVVVRNSSPEIVSELIRRHMFCSMDPVQEREIRFLTRDLNAERRKLHRFRILLGALKSAERLLHGARGVYRRSRNRTRRFIREQRHARREAWRARQ